MTNEELVHYASKVIKFLRTYHHHKVIGIEHIPKQGRALLVLNHSLATYDMTLLFGEILEKKNRIPRALVDRLFFKIPYLGDFVEAVGVKEGSHENAYNLLEDEHLVAVAPGGMREALRPSSERYQILWKKRRGFIKLAIETRTPIIVSVCPKADDIFDVYSSHSTSYLYKKFRVPVFFARGLGPTLIPRPIKLIHFIGEAIIPPKKAEDPKAFSQQIYRLHKRVIKRTQELISDAIAYR